MLKRPKLLALPTLQPLPRLHGLARPVVQVATSDRVSHVSPAMILQMWRVARLKDAVTRLTRGARMRNTASVLRSGWLRRSVRGDL